MKTWQKFKEGRFDNVDLGGNSPLQQMARARRNLAKTLQELMDEGELRSEMSLQQVIDYLTKN